MLYFMKAQRMLSHYAAHGYKHFEDTSMYLSSPCSRLLDGIIHVLAEVYNWTESIASVNNIFLV